MDTEEDYTDTAVERIKKIWKECKLKDSQILYRRKRRVSICKFRQKIL